MIIDLNISKLMACLTIKISVMLKTLLLSLVFVSLSLTAYSQKWIIFHASDINVSAKSWAGHAFVTFVERNPLTKQTIEVGTWGFYPRYGIGVFGPVPGTIKDDLKKSKDHSFAISVTETEFKNALQIPKKWQSKDYELSARNCIFFLGDIVASIPKLKAPDYSYEFPSDVIEELTKINAQYAIPLPINMEEFNKPKPTQSIDPYLSANSLSAPFFDLKTVFKNYTKTNLKPGQMDRIVENLPVKYNPKTKKFYEKLDKAMEEPTEVEVYQIDLNKDGEPEIIVQRYNHAYLGQAGAVIILYKGELDTYVEAMNERGTAMILTTKSMNGYPDILLGGPGMKVPGYIWNMGKYVFRRMYPFAQGNAPKTIPFDKY
jgi:hypothetical protein